MGPGETSFLNWSLVSWASSLSLLTGPSSDDGAACSTSSNVRFFGEVGAIACGGSLIPGLTSTSAIVDAFDSIVAAVKEQLYDGTTIRGPL